jgi:hypothetical protein
MTNFSKFFGEAPESIGPNKEMFVVVILRKAKLLKTRPGEKHNHLNSSGLYEANPPFPCGDILLYAVLF